ncbi:hypothetical protein Tco_0546756 [Tanacetum coccineum]
MLRTKTHGWNLLLQEFDIEIRDNKGAENLAADHRPELENPHKTNSHENQELNEAFPPRSSWFDSLKTQRCQHYFWDDPVLFKICADQAYVILPLELEQQSYWDPSITNFDDQTAGDHRKVSTE